jgi:hypothetical protein
MKKGLKTKLDNKHSTMKSVCGICGKPALENNLCYEHLVCNVPKPTSKQINY